MAEITLDQAPRKVRDLFEKAASAVERNNLDYAVDVFLAVVQLEPALLAARRALRGAQIKRFRESGGSNPVKQALTLVSAAGAVFRIKGAIPKDPKTALLEAERLLSRDPYLPAFYTLQAEAALAAELPEAAILTLEAVRETRPDDIPLLRKLGKIYLQVEKTAKGVECFERVAALKPNDPTSIKHLKDAQAMDTMRKGRWDQAGDKGDFRKMVRDQDGAKQLEQESKAVKTESDLENLISEMRIRIQREPQNVNYRRALADYLTKANRLEEALASLRESSELSGGGDPQIDRAISALKLRMFDRRIETLVEQGKTKEAEAIQTERDHFRFTDAEDRVRRYPNDLQFKFEFGVMLYERGQWNEAIQQLQLAQRNAQRRLRALYYLALCFKGKEQYDIAHEQLEKAASEVFTMDDTRKDVVYELGVINEIMGRTQKAAEYFKEIYAVDIGFRDVAQRIEKTYKAQS